jgi:hypothetical protein
MSKQQAKNFIFIFHQLKKYQLQNRDCREIEFVAFGFPYTVHMHYTTLVFEIPSVKRLCAPVFKFKAHQNLDPVTPVKGWYRY